MFAANRRRGCTNNPRKAFVLLDLPLSFAGASAFFPKPSAAEKSIFVFPPFDSPWKPFKPVHIAAAENDVIGVKRFLQLADGKNHFTFPTSEAEPFYPGNTEEIFDNVAMA